MIKAVPTKTIVRIRDHLLAMGRDKSAAARDDDSTHPLDGDDEAKKLLDAVAESMFLMIASDQKIEATERDAFRGALRELTAGLAAQAWVDAITVQFETALKEQGQAKRIAEACAILKGSKESAEAAFILSAALAFADDEIADAENEVMNELAGQLGITEERAGELLDELEEDSGSLGFQLIVGVSACS